jgi:hypothetical protein
MNSNAIPPVKSTNTDAADAYCDPFNVTDFGNAE